MEDKPKKLIVLGLIGFIVLVVLLFLFSNSIIIVSSDNKEPLTIQRAGESSPEDISAGFHILKKGQYEFNRTQGISSTKKFVTLKPFVVNRVSMSIEPQSSVKKIARGAEDCVFGSMKSLERGVVGSYKCLEPTSIFQNTYLASSEKKVLVSGEEFNLGNPVPYKEGLVSIGFGEGGNTLLHITGGEVKIRSLSEITNTQNTQKNYKLAVESNNIYLLDTETKSVFIFDSPSGVPKKVSLSIDEKTLSANSVLRVYDSKIYLVNPVDVKDEENKDSFEEGSLYVFSQNQTSPEKKISLGHNIETLLNFSVLNHNTIFGSSINQEVSVYDISSRLKHTDTIKDVSHSVAVNDSVFVLIKNAIYRYDVQSRSLVLAFGSSNIDVTFITKFDNSLIFSGSSNNETEPANQTYILKNDALDGNKEWREEDVLPFGDVNGLPISWMDYFGNSLYVVLDLDSLQNNLSGEGYTFDQKEFSDKSNFVINEFSRRGVNKDNYQVNIRPY